MQKPLLKQAPRQWYQKLDDTQKIFGMKSTNYDSCVYSNSDGSLLLALYVDDGLVAGKSEGKITTLLDKLKEKFETTDSKAKYYLGIEIQPELSTRKIYIHQSAYTRNILRKFDVDIECNVNTVGCKHRVTSERI